MDSTRSGALSTLWPAGAELVVEEDDHGLAFDDGLAGGALLVEGICAVSSLESLATLSHFSRSKLWSCRAWTSSWAITGF